VYCIQFDSENDLLISSSQDTTVKLWDMSATTAKLNCTLKGHTGPVGSVSFLPSADLAISGSDDKTIRVWNTAKGEAKDNCVKVISTGGEDGVWALQFDAQRLVADLGDKSMGMWDTETMEQLTKFSGHT
jgi:WD40 repeat protein